MNENEGRKKREWVKNAAIVFLTIMLILTFFSNTIMNYSLPEVASTFPVPRTLAVIEPLCTYWVATSGRE